MTAHSYAAFAGLVALRTTAGVALEGRVSTEIDSMETNNNANMTTNNLDATERLALLTGAIQGTITQFETYAANAEYPAQATAFRMYANNLRTIVDRWGSQTWPINGPGAIHGRRGHQAKTPAPVQSTASAHTSATTRAKSKRPAHSSK